MAALDSFKQVVTQGDGIGARAQHRTVVHRGNLYFMMGQGATGFGRLGDMYSSNDGITWKRRASLVDTNGNTITAKLSPGLVSHNEKVYLLGGYDGTSRNYVYVTSDMVTWTKLPNAPWDGRYEFVALSFDERIWVLGGRSSSNLNDVWWTRDGVHWTQEPNAPWPARLEHAGIVYNNMMYIIGGKDVARYNDVWYTADGRNWTRMESSALFSGVNLLAVESFGKGDVRSRMVLVGGETGTGVYSDKL